MQVRNSPAGEYFHDFVRSNVLNPNIPGLGVTSTFEMSLGALPKGVKDRVRLGLETGVCTATSGNTREILRSLLDVFGIYDVIFLSPSGNRLEVRTASEELIELLRGANRLARPAGAGPSYRPHGSNDLQTVVPRTGMRYLNPCWLKPAQARRQFSEALGTPDHANRREAIRFLAEGGVLRAHVSY